jgi:hypothetical protein
MKNENKKYQRSEARARCFSVGILFLRNMALCQKLCGKLKNAAKIALCT